MLRTFSSAPFFRVVHHLSRRFTDLGVLGKDEKTIFALSTGAGKAGIAIVRISGSEVNATALQVCRSLPKPRLASSVKIYSPITNNVIDHGLAIRFPGPASFTGEDVLELHLHGGPAVIRETLNALGSLPGLRPAAAGEFSQRAFENGKLDLTQAEGIMDLINAETEQQRIQALRQTEGELGSILEHWRADLKKSLAYTEAFIDFSEDERIEPETLEASSKDARQVLAEVTRFLADGRRGERLRDGARIAIIGPPNAGKSSLINLLAKRSVSIVSPTPGTTRDVVEATLDIGGFPVVLGDTAGIRNTPDLIEQEGIQRTAQAIQHADVILFVLDGSTAASEDTETSLTFLQKSGAKVITIMNKTDLPRQLHLDSPADVVSVSCKTRLGVDELYQKLAAVLKDR